MGFSVFAGDADAPRDTESAAVWTSLGVAQERIAYLPKEDNWWIAGQTGPCGPDTEMFYWVDDGTPAPENFQKSKAKFCFECEVFPCDRLNHLDKRYRTKYNMSMIENLANIKKAGIGKFLESEKTRWTCKNCGGVICVHKKYCYNCGKNN